MIIIDDILKYLDNIRVSYEFNGSVMTSIVGISSAKYYKKDCITWIKTEIALDYFQDIENVSAAIVQEGIDSDIKNAIYVKHSKQVFFNIAAHFFSDNSFEKYIQQNCYVADDATIGKNFKMGCNCYINSNVEIGDNVCIGNNVSIESRTHIGDNCIIESGVIIGADGFGYYRDLDDNYKRVPHFGGVWIGNEVEIGANSVICKGTIDDTSIDDNSKIALGRRIAHNVRIGKRCIILGSTGGSCEIGDDSYIAPYSFVKNQIKVGSKCMVNSHTFLKQNLQDGHIADGKRIVKIDYRQIFDL